MSIQKKVTGTLSPSGGSCLYTCAHWRRKEPELNADNCKVEAVVELDNAQFCVFQNHLLENYDFIREHVDLMYRDRLGLDHCLLVLGEGHEEGVLVESEGSAYARYSALLPNARSFVYESIQNMADTLIREGSVQAANSTWQISFDEISKHFDCVITPRNNLGQMLIAELKSREDVNNLTVREDYIGLAFHPELAHSSGNTTEQGPTLFTLMGCNLEDVHIVHEDEEHDLATITELNHDTLTAQGKTDWADVLEAKVTRIYEGYYGIQIEVSGCEASRLEDFSKMLAGYCSISEYDRWVNSDVNPTNHNEVEMQSSPGV